MSSPTTLRSPAGGNESSAAAQIARERFPELSSREAEVLVLLAEGLKDACIAARLSIGVRTAESHVASILTKLGVENRTAAAMRYARETTAEITPRAPRRPPAP